MQKRLKRIFALICAFALLVTTVLGNGALRLAQAADDQEPTPVTLNGFENVTIKDFSKNGVQMSEGAYECTDATYGNYDCYALTDGTSMNKKLFDVNVTFTQGGGSAERIDIAGSGDWSGFMIYPSNDGSYLYVVSNTAYGTTSEWQHAELSATNAGVTSFLNNEFLLQLSFEFGTVGGDNKADILVGVYVNGEKRTEHTFTGCNMAKFGGAIGIYRQAEGAVVTVSSVEIPREITPVYLDGFNHITLKDFKDAQGNVMEAGEYEGAATGAHKDFYATGLTSFHDTVLSMKVKFEAGSYKNSLILAGNGGWCGFNIHPNNDGSQLVVDKTWISGMTTSETPTLSAGVAGVGSFLNEEFLLQLSFEYSEAVGGKSDLTLGIYINGSLYNNQNFTIAACDTSKIGTVLAPYRQDDGKSIFLDNVIIEEDTEPDTPDEPTEIIPVELEGFTNLTIKDFQDASGNAMPTGEFEGSSAGANNDYYVDGLANFDKHLLSMRITYEGGEYKHSLVVGGTGEWSGFNLRPNGDGSILFVDSSWAGSIINKDTYVAPYMTAELAGLESFIGEDILLQLSFEYGEEVGGKADLTIGVYINGKLYNNQEFVIPGCKVSAMGSHLALYREVDGSAIIVNNVVLGETESEQPSEDLEKVTFSHFGVDNGTYASAPDVNVKGTYTKGDSVNGIVLCGDVQLINSNAGEIDIMLGSATNVWEQGIRLTKYGAANDLRLIYQTASSYKEILTITPKDAGVDFISEKFNLMWSIELVDSDNDANQDDLKIGLWFDEVLYENEYCYITDYLTNSTLGNVFATYCASGTSISLNSDPELEDEEEPDEPTEIIPVELEGFEDVTIRDFVDASGKQMEEKTYVGTAGGVLSAFTWNGAASLNKTLLNMNVKFTGGGGNARLDVAGSGEWSGFSVYSSNTGEYLHIYTNYGAANPTVGIDMSATTAGISSFINNEFLLQLSLEFIDSDNDNAKDDLAVGVYVNGVLYNDTVQIIPNCDLAKFGNYIGVYCEGTDRAIMLGSVGEESSGESQQPSEDLEKVTFSQYDIASDTYAYNGDLVVKGALKDKESVAGTVLCGDVELVESGHFQLILGGGNNAWDGIRFVTDNAQAMHAWWYEGTNGTHFASFDSSVAGVAFQNEEFNLMISTELIDNDGDGNVNDIKLGVWFNNVLYENEYIIMPNLGANLANGFAAYCAGTSSSVILTSDPDLVGEDVPIIPDEPQEPNEDFEKVTFAHFNIKDGSYPYNGDIVVQSTLKGHDTLDKTVICGDILLDGSGGYQLLFGGKDDVWAGLRLVIDKAEAMHLYWFEETMEYITTFTSVGAGTEFIGKQFNLMLSTEVVDKNGDGNTNDVKFGLWINGVLYANQFVYVNDRGDELGNRFGAYCSGTDASVTLNSIPELVPEPELPKKPNENFEKITFEYFGAKDGTYKYDGTDAPTFEGKGAESFDRKVLCGDVLFSGKGENHFMVGGNGNTWYGLRFITKENGTIVLYWIDDEGLQLIDIFDSTTAGATLVDEWLNLMISTEIIDADDDGAKDDIELGVWFNGVLYKEEFYTILDKESGLGKQFGFDCSAEDNSIAIRSIPELVKGFDYSVYGLTKDWQKTLLTDHKAETAVGGSRDAEPFTGDLLEVGAVCLFGMTAIAALLTSIYMVLKRKKES